MNDISLKSLAPILSAVGGKIQAYAGFFLFLLFAVIYGFLVMQINKYSYPTIDDSEVLKITASPTSGIDEDAANKLLLLEDNSVNVQTLFREGRTNPFQE